MRSALIEIQDGRVRFYEDASVIILLASALPISPRAPTELKTESGFYIAGGLLYLAEKMRNNEIISKNNHYFQVENGDVYLYGEKDTIFLKAADRFNKDAPPAQLTAAEAAEFGKKLFELAQKISMIDHS